MKEFLKRLKIIDHLTTELEISKNDFVKKFKDHVDEGEIGMFSSSFEAFSSSKNEYKGKVGYDGFKIRRRRSFFQINSNLVIAEGKFITRNDILVIETEINGFHGFFVFTYLIGIIIYPVFFFSLFFADNSELNSAMLVAIPLLLIHATFWFGGPYLLMKRSTKKMKYDLAREFFFMTKK